MKRVSKFLLMVMLLCLPVTVIAGDSIIKYGIDINGKALNMDVNPVEQNDRILVPFRAIAEGLGMQVSWDEGTNTVTAVKNGKKIVFNIDSKTALVDGKEITLDVPVIIVNDRTMVPVRFLAENIGAAVKWDEDNFKVVIATDEQKPASTPVQPAVTSVPATSTPAPVVVVPSQSGSQSGQSSDTEKQKLLSQIVSKYQAKLSTLRGSASSQLNGVIDAAKSEFLSLPKDQQTSENKGSIYGKYLPQAEALYDSISAQVDSILNDMTAELQSNDLPTDSADQAKTSFNNEVQTKVTELFQKLN